MTREKVLNMVKELEDKDIKYINKQWFYQASKYNYEKYKSILSDGILCNYLLMNKSYKYNGPYYISIIRDLGSEFKYSSYLQYLESVPMLILNENIDALPTLKETILGKLLINTKSTHRISEFDDEYQVPFKIETKDIIGIEFYFEKILKNSMQNDKVITPFFELKSLVNLMNELNIDLPIFDYSTYKEINKDKVLKLQI